MPSGCAAGLAAATQGGTILCSLKWQATFFIHISIAEKDFLVAQMVKNPPAMRETKVQSLGCEIVVFLSAWLSEVEMIYIV